MTLRDELKQRSQDLWTTEYEMKTNLLFKQAYERIETLESILRKVFPEKSGQYFICGEMGSLDSNGLPEKIQICPAYGCDWSQIYERTDKTVGGMGS
jgi:hypothetical protein